MITTTHAYGDAGYLNKTREAKKKQNKKNTAVQGSNVRNNDQGQSKGSAVGAEESPEYCMQSHIQHISNGTRCGGSDSSNGQALKLAAEGWEASVHTGS